MIVGAGPSGLETASFLSYLSIPHIILEREISSSSLWRKRAYDDLQYNLILPYLSGIPDSMPRNEFYVYLDAHVSTFSTDFRYGRVVESSCYEATEGKWRLEALNILSQQKEVYVAEFLVAATEENSRGFIPRLPGLDTFPGEIIHSNEYQSGLGYQDQEVLVFGFGNTGMKTSYDLSNSGAHTAVVVRNPVHVLTKEMVSFGTSLLKCLSITRVDSIMNSLQNLFYGDLPKYGIVRSIKGPFTHKAENGKNPVIDVGTISKIRAGDIKVYPEIVNINGSEVEFANGVHKVFDVIVFATGYQSGITEWLEDYQYLVREDGLPKNDYPNHWKGEHGVYCAGISRSGPTNGSEDARAIVNDINKVIRGRKKVDPPTL